MSTKRLSSRAMARAKSRTKAALAPAQQTERQWKRRAASGQVFFASAPIPTLRPRPAKKDVDASPGSFYNGLSGC